MNKDQNKPVAAALPAIPEGWKLVPVEPTAEILAGAAIAAWPTATLADFALARKAAEIVVMQMDLAAGATVDSVAGMIATMAPAYRSMLAAAPTPPVEQPSQPQDQSASIRPSAEPASQLDAPGGVDLDKLEALAKDAEQMFTGMHWYTRFQILDGISNDESAALIGALGPDTVLKLIALARKADQSNIAEPDTATQAPSESKFYFRQTSSFGPMIECAPDEEGAQEFQRATQVAKPLTDAQIGNINRAALALKLAGYGDLAESMYSIHSHLKGE